MPFLIELTANTRQHRAWFSKYWLQPIAAGLANGEGANDVEKPIIFLV